MTVLNVFQAEIDEETAVQNIATSLDLPTDEATETFEEIRDLLHDNGVLAINGELSDESQEVEPHFQVNAVENVLVIAATQGCNLACHHCYANARKRLPNEMTTNEIKRLIDNLASMAWKNEISRVGLTGGELFSRPDALEVVDYTHRKGFKVLVSTNGLLLTDEVIAQLATYDRIKLSISLDGPTAEVHEFIRGEGTFERTLTTIRALTARAVFVGANMFVHAGNIELIEETLHLADELRISAFNCINLMRVGRANSRRSQTELTRVPELVLYQKLFQILRRNSRFQELMQNSTFANQVMGIAGGVKSHYCGIGTNRALYVRADGVFTHVQTLLCRDFVSAT